MVPYFTSIIINLVKYPEYKFFVEVYQSAFKASRGKRVAEKTVKQWKRAFRSNGEGQIGDIKKASNYSP